jgi:hypothetical protein
MANMNKEIIGYQIYSDTTMPSGIFSFMVFRDYFKAIDYIVDQHLERYGFKPHPVIGDINKIISKNIQ